MTLPILKINLSQIGNHGGTLGYDYIVGALRDSPLFEIKDHKDSLNVVKGCRGTILYFNDRKIYLDFWEYTAPTHNDVTIDANFDLIIKLQDIDKSDTDYIQWARNKSYFPTMSNDVLKSFWNKIIPWTFFPSRMLMPYIGREQDLISLPIEQMAFFCGRNWKARHNMKKKLEGEKIKYICNEVQGQRISDEEFLHSMLSSKYGIVLPGRSTYVSDCKNRREIDYMMMRKPLLISYHPYYYDPLIPGKHFVLINDKTNFADLENMYNMKEMVENAFQWYKRNATPEGIAKSFLKIMTDKGFNT